jgi:hypothetical protein
MQGFIQKIKSIPQNIKKIKLRKIHLEYITAVLSIPVLITAIIINVGNLTNKKVVVSATPTPIMVPPRDPQNRQNVTPTPTAQICQKTVGPVSITSPTEGQTVTDNPLCIIIKYADSNYCSVVWSYRLNNGSWSEYNSSSPCLYSLANGDVSFELRVKSTVSSDQETLTRNFIYAGNSNPTTTPTITPSPTVTNTPTTTVVPTAVVTTTPTK